MNGVTLYGVTIPTWVFLPVAYFLWVSILLIIKKVLFVRVQKFAKKTKTHLDDILLEALNLPLLLLIFTSGIFVIEHFSLVEMEDNLLQYFILAFKTVTIVAIILFFDRLFRNLIQNYTPQVDVLKSSGGMAQGIIRVVVIGLGLLILLDSYEVSITPIIASLGIGSLAVALALQPTLENFFAGIQILTDKPIKVGQFVKLDSGEKGYIHKIGWRSTWLRMIQNNIVVIPNKTLVGEKILNYYYPLADMVVHVQVGVHYNSDLKYVEKVTIEVGEEIMKTITGGVPDFKPFIRYHTFNDSSIDFTVILRCKEFMDNYLVKHEFIKALKERYDKEGITIPFPIRAINYEQEGAEPQKS